jgi:hypothetical protein
MTDIRSGALSRCAAAATVLHVTASVVQVSRTPRWDARRVPATRTCQTLHQAADDGRNLDEPGGRLSQWPTFPRLVFQKRASMNIPSSFKFSLAALATAGAALAPAVSHAQSRPQWAPANGRLP